MDVVTLQMATREARRRHVAAGVIESDYTASDIQAVFDEVSAAGGGPVFPRTGLYSIGATLNLPWRVHLLNFGWAGYGQSSGFAAGSTNWNDVRFQLANGVNAPILQSKQDKGLSSSYYQQSSVVQGLAFLGNSANNTMPADKGLVWFSDVQAVAIENCTAMDSAGHGISMRRSIVSRIRANSALTNALSGIYFYGDADDSQISGNQCGTNSDHGIYLVGATLLRVFENKSFNNGDHGIYLKGNGVSTSFNCSIMGNDCDDNNDSGLVVFDGKHHTITGNVCTRNANNGIRLGGTIEPASNCTVTANISGNTPGGTKQDYGLRIDDNCANNEFVGNDLTGNNTAPMLLSTTGTGSNRFTNNGGLQQPGFGFPYTLDPRAPFAAGGLGTANRRFYMRVIEGGLISKIGLHVGISSGNISLAVHRNNGSEGRAARPGALAITSGSVACPATGYNEVSLGGSVWVYPGDWLSLSADNTTATFGRIFNSLGAGLANGLSQLEASAFTAPATAAGSPDVSVYALIGVA